MTNPIDTLLNGLDDPWGDDDAFNVSEEDMKKAEFTRMFEVYSGEVTVVSAQHIFDKKAAKDDAFHSFNVVVANADGETKTMYYQISFKKVGYGERNSMYQLSQIKKLGIALGFGEISLRGSELKAYFKKYFGQFDANGYLKKWEGLKFYGSWKYKTGSLHIGSCKDGFEVLDADNNRAIFSEITVLDKIKNDLIKKFNCPIVGITRDEVKAILGQSGLKAGMSDLVKIVGLERANDKLLAAFDTSIKPSGVNDAHAQVKSNEDDVAF